MCKGAIGGEGRPLPQGRKINIYIKLGAHKENDSCRMWGGGREKEETEEEK